jgi:hypothetical protein
MTASFEVEPAEAGPAKSVSANANADGAATRSRSRLWLWFLAAFLVQAAVWTVWFVIAAHHRVEEVPLAYSERAQPVGPARSKPRG